MKVKLLLELLPQLLPCFSRQSPSHPPTCTLSFYSPDKGMEG